MKALIALSGGIDSAVAACLLREAGHEIVGGVTMTRGDAAQGTPGPGMPEDLRTAAALCARLGFPHCVISVADAFEAFVGEPCRAAYRAGYTPNACVCCNPAVKFGALPERARAAGLSFEVMATGHYARIARLGATPEASPDAPLAAEAAAALEAVNRARLAGPPLVFRRVPGAADARIALLCGIDPDRDQAYFLYRLTAQQLAHTLFPLGGMHKRDVRARAAALGLTEVAEKPDSQDLCIDRAELLGRDEQPGEITDETGHVLGYHTGFWRFTPGQRKGVGLSGFPEPLFVKRLEPETNRVVVGPASSLQAPALEVDQASWTSIEPPPPGTVFTCGVKPRSAGRPLPDCRVEILPDNRFRVTRPEGFRAPSPGQSAVLYSGSLLLGGGRVANRRAAPAICRLKKQPIV